MKKKRKHKSKRKQRKRVSCSMYPVIPTIRYHVNVKFPAVAFRTMIRIPYNFQSFRCHEYTMRSAPVEISPRSITVQLQDFVLLVSLALVTSVTVPS